jgi:hypothetical protein
MLYFGLVAGTAAGNLAAHARGVDAFRVFAATLREPEPQKRGGGPVPDRPGGLSHLAACPGGTQWQMI